MRIPRVLYPFCRNTFKKHSSIQSQQIKYLSNEVPSEVPNEVSNENPKSSKKKRKGEEKIVHVKGEILIGCHSIRMALDNPRRKIYTVYYNKGSDGERITEVVNLSESKGIKIKPTNRNFLNQFACSSLHRGICADAQPIHPESGDKLVDELSIEDIQMERLWLLLCSIGDPFNLGAIIRSAYFLGVEHIFLCSPYDSTQASSPLNSVASRTSAGILEIFTPKVIFHPEAFLDKLQHHGWQIIAAMPENGQNVSKISNLDGTAIKSRLLVVGNEGEGLSSSITDKCNMFESISPGRKLHPRVDSLNVSVATALLMERLLSR